jgi:Ser/Thr protein kinase RdoA (MazF antagonist)
VIVSPELAHLGARLLELFSRARGMVLDELTRAEGLRVCLTPCLRDIWHDHVLFVGDQVTGFVDFGALKAESVAADVARLLGSLLGDDREGWEIGLNAYQRHRPLSRDELELVAAFDQANVLLAGIQWLEWIYLEHRKFERLDLIVDRVSDNLSRLTVLASRAALTHGIRGP